MTSDEMKAIGQMLRDQAAEEGMAFSGKIIPEILRETVETMAAAQPVEPGVTFIPDSVGGIEAEISVPPEIENEHILVYIHGGGFILGSIDTEHA